MPVPHHSIFWLDALPADNQQHQSTEGTEIGLLNAKIQEVQVYQILKLNVHYKMSNSTINRSQPSLVKLLYIIIE